MRAQALRPYKSIPVTFIGYFLGDIAAGGHLENELNSAKNQKTMNKAAAHMAQQADKPDSQQDGDKCIKHF